MSEQQPPNNTQTLTITNFGGRLTRKLNGDLNSGLAKFSTSWGYDPFSKPDNLTWFEQPVDISNSSIAGLVMATKTHFEGGTTFVYAVDTTAKIYKIQPNGITSPNVDSIVAIGSIITNSGAPSFNFGASMELFGNSSMLYISSDTRVDKINTDFSAALTVTTSVVSNKFHPLTQFVGELMIGNGNNIQAIDSTNALQPSLVSSGALEGFGIISPPLPVGTTITDIDVSIDGNYLLLTGSNINSENIGTVSNDRQNASGGQGVLFRWNGIDKGITSETFISSYNLTALQTYLGNQMIFADDFLGASVGDGNEKLLSLPNNKAPFSNATAINGNFVTWVNPEIDQNTSMVSAMYYFGQLDQENQPGLWRVMRNPASIASGFVYQNPVNVIVNNRYRTVNNAVTSIVTLGYGKHYFSSWEVNPSNTAINSGNSKLFRFLVTSSGTGTPQLGSYETQTQLFSKKVVVKQIRVYTEPTASNQGFQVDLIGSDGSTLTAPFIYNFVAGTDPTLLQGSIDRINFNPQMNGSYAIGLRLTNLGTVNMTIKKVELDIQISGK